jgi:hypothetical protein
MMKERENSTMCAALNIKLLCDPSQTEAASVIFFSLFPYYFRFFNLYLRYLFFFCTVSQPVSERKVAYHGSQKACEDASKEV